MISNETFVCTKISHTIVNNNTIIIAKEGRDLKPSDTFSMKRCDSFEELPPPTHCSTPKAKGTGAANALCCSENKHFTRQTCPTPISTWMDELRDCYYPECTTTLQSKSLMVDVNGKVRMLASLTSKVIRTLHHQTYSVAKEFDHIYRCLEMNCTKFIPGLVDDLINHMVGILLQHSDGWLDLNFYQEVANQTMEKLEQGQLPHLVWQLNALALDFSKRIDKLLLLQMEVLIGVLTSIENSTALMTILNSFTELGLQYDHLGSLLSRCTGISTLLQIARNSSNPPNARTLALKLLSSILCAPSAVIHMSESDGLRSLVTILTENNRQLLEKRYTMVAIAQLTNPKFNVRVSQPLMSTIIREETSSPILVTELIKLLPCSQTLTLGAITMANFSMCKESVGPLMENSTIAVLLSAIKQQGPDANIVIKEQAATIIANLSESPQAVSHLCQNRVVPALLCFLNTELNEAPNTDSPNYRLQHKCALALARLCSEKDAISQIEQLKGVPKLLKLCRQSINKKNDHRLLACLEAIKRILNKSNASSMLHSAEAPPRLASITTR